MLKIINNPDVKKYEKVTKAVKENGGYCPCMVNKTPNTKCMCEEFRKFYESGKEGSCRCGRFISVDE